MLCWLAVGSSNPRVYTNEDGTNGHVRTIKTLKSLLEFGGLREHEKTPHALVGLGSAALAAAVALPGYGGPNFLQGINKCI